MPLWPLPLQSCPRLSTPPTLTAAATTSAASTFQIAIFVTVFIDVEKAIIWASRSGNRVLVGVARDKPCSLRSHPARGVGGNELQLGRVRGLCLLFSLHPHVREQRQHFLPTEGRSGLGVPVRHGSERHAQHVGCWLLPQN